MNEPFVIGNDTSHNCQAQARPSFFGRKMREKQFIPVRRIDAHAVIRKINFDPLGLVIPMGRNLDQALLIVQSIQCVVKQVDEYASYLLGIDIE